MRLSSAPRCASARRHGRRRLSSPPPSNHSATCCDHVEWCSTSGSQPVSSHSGALSALERRRDTPADSCFAHHRPRLPRFRKYKIRVTGEPAVPTRGPPTMSHSGYQGSQRRSPWSEGSNRVDLCERGRTPGIVKLHSPSPARPDWHSLEVAADSRVPTRQSSRPTRSSSAMCFACRIRSPSSPSTANNSSRRPSSKSVSCCSSVHILDPY